MKSPFKSFGGWLLFLTACCCVIWMIRGIVAGLFGFERKLDPNSTLVTRIKAELQLHDSVVIEKCTIKSFPRVERVVLAVRNQPFNEIPDECYGHTKAPMSDANKFLEFFGDS